MAGRRLPVWMLGVAKTDNIRNSNAADSEIEGEVKDDDNNSVVENSHAARKGKGLAGGGLVKCGTRKRRANIGDVDGMEEDGGGARKKRVKKSVSVVERTVRGSARVKKEKQEGGDNEEDLLLTEDIEEDITDDSGGDYDRGNVGKKRGSKSSCGVEKARRGSTRLKKQKKESVFEQEGSSLSEGDDDFFGGNARKRWVAKSGNVVKKAEKGSGRVRKPKESKGRLDSDKEKEELLGSEDDEEELTVEDLMSIAKEYVEADKQEHHQTDAAINPEPVKELPPPSPLYRNSEVAQSRWDLPASAAPSYSTTSTSTRLSEYENSASQNIISQPISTGDPAQDMLNLFLGPLLSQSQPQIEKKLVDVYENLPSEFRQPSQSEVTETKLPVITKKKTSLKDKMSMFFD